MQKSKFNSWFANAGRTTAPSNVMAKLALESLNVRVLPSVAGGACIAPPVCHPVACDVSHAKPESKDKVEHGATARGDQHSVCLFGVEVGKGHEKSSHGKNDCKPPKPIDACSKSNGGKQKSSHGKSDCTPKPVECPVPVPPTPCPPPPPVVCLPPTPPPVPCPVPVPPPATCPPPADACSKSHGGNQKSSHGKSSHGTVDLCSETHGGGQKSSHTKSSHTKSAHTKSSHGNCYDDGYAMPGRASDMVRALCGV